MLRTLEPMFTIDLGVPPHALADLSFLQIVDHLEYLEEREDRGGQA